VCPFCTGEHAGLHLGYDLVGNKFVCWRCGGHWTDLTISKLLNITKQEANTIIRQYGALTRKAPEMKRKIRILSFKLPANTSALQANHTKYLTNRMFDVDKLVHEWKIQGTGVSAKLDNIEYKHRIVIPFFWNGVMVSFDSRDITNKSQYKYMACPEARELIGHKQILYGRKDKWGKTGICVEGPTDVWRFGFNSFATSGIKYTPAQLRIMAKTFTRIPVIFDNDIGNPQAKIQANKLVAELKFRGVDAFRVDIEGDPGGMKQTEADYLIKQLLK